MNSTVKILGVLLASAAFAGSPLRADDKPASKIAALFPDEVLVKGNGFEIKRSDLDEAVANVKADSAAGGQEIPPDKLPMIEVKLLDHLTQVELIKPKATEADKAKSKDESTHRMEAIRKQFPSDEAMRLQLKARGMSEEQFLRRLNDETIFETVLRGKVTVTDEQVKKFYDDTPAQFEEPEMVRASHIMLATKDPKSGTEAPEAEKQAKKKQIEDLLKRARAGEDFGKLVKEFSDDNGSKEKGGEYLFAKGTPGLPDEFKAAAFSLKTNQVSDVVVSPFGYHIIKLNEKIPAHTIELAKVSGNIHIYLEKLAIEKFLPPYYEQLKKEADVQFVDEKYKALEADAAALALKTLDALKSPKPQDKGK